MPSRFARAPQGHPAQVGRRSGRAPPGDGGITPTTSHDAPGTAVVTGASSGIGWEYATRLAARGWGLVLVARRAERLDVLAEEALKEGAAGIETLVADLGSPEDLSRVVERAADDDIDLVVNNAGINGYGPFAEVDAGLLTRVLNVNVVALTALTRAAVPGMPARGRGAVINVASLLAFAGDLPPDPLPRRAVYAGSKGYAVTFTRTPAAELAGTPLRVQVVCRRAHGDRVPPRRRGHPGER
ncbi:SDR family NAD(P)-dependent oxidoreductase [Streptomyces albogriseolus]|uniref:SDR family NAD(P)-dependent oxidoreductase n=1 Tax=Streptomyces albogriseolus TaxID=1887 RepID=UPI0034617069